MQTDKEDKEIKGSLDQVILSVLTEEESFKNNDFPPADSKGKNFLSWTAYILLWLLIGLLVSQFVLQRNTVYGESMLPTLNHGDELLVEKVSRFFGGISRGDIITCKSYIENSEKNSSLVKRVIGIPGEEVEIRDGYVYIDGSQLREDYLAAGIETLVVCEDFSNIKLAEDEYYLLGDNRSHSQDSRCFGPVKKADITGEILIRFYPFNRFGIP